MAEAATETAAAAVEVLHARVVDMQQEGEAGAARERELQERLARGARDMAEREEKILINGEMAEEFEKMAEALQKEVPDHSSPLRSCFFPATALKTAASTRWDSKDFRE